MQIVEKLESFSIPLLGSLNRLCFCKPGGLRLSWLGQGAFPGRIQSDAANYLYVVLVAASFGSGHPPRLAYKDNKLVALVRFASLSISYVTFVTEMSRGNLGQPVVENILMTKIRQAGNGGPTLPMPRFSW